jgi:hypothetical protein
MSAGYARWLIARGNAFSPGAAAVTKLIDKLREEGWIGGQGAGGVAVITVENTFGEDAAAKRAASTKPLPAEISTEWLDDPDREELRMVWPVTGPTTLKYPLSQKPEGAATYALEIHRASEYVVPSSETIEAVPTICQCGEDLAFEWDDEELVPTFARSSGIFAECEDCSRTFDPSKGTAEIENPFDGSRAEVRGGAAYRFALKVDCGKAFVASAQLAFAPELVALVEKHFGRELFEVGTRY